LGLQCVRLWTAEEDLRLQFDWGYLSIAQIARRSGRTPFAIYRRACELKLPLGCPEGYERLTQACNRTGYALGQMRRILRFAGVRIRRGWARPRAQKRLSYHHSWIVDRLEVDGAVRDWQSTEAVGTAANLRGIGGERLRRLVVLDGCPVRKSGPGKRAHWRVATTDIDRIVQEKGTGA
jgi:hypothetical protein